MTGSRHNTSYAVFSGNLKKGGISTLFLALFLCCTPLSAQEQSPEPDEQPEETTQTEDKAAEARSLYYLGKKPPVRRQQGPAVGAPVSILPQPFVPKGSIALPPPPEEASAGNPVTDSLTPQSDPSEMAEDPAGMTDDPAEILPDDPVTDGETPAGDPFLEESALAQLDPSGMGVLPPGTGYAKTFWQGLSREQIIEKYSEFSNYAGSPAMREIAAKIALSHVLLPTPNGDADITAMLDARLTLLEKTGNGEGYRALLDKLPAGKDWSGLARHFSNAYLMEGRLSDACSLAAEERTTDSNPYWVRIAAFCNAANGNRQGVDFELQILSEVIDIQPAFYRLIDQILIEAEQPANAVETDAGTLTSPLRVGLLETAMARLARTRIEAIDPSDASPLAVTAMLALPGLAEGAKTALMGTGLRYALVPADEIAAFARSVSPTPVDPDTLMTEEQQQGRFVADAPLLREAATGTAQNRHYMMREFWAAAATGGYSAAAAPGLLALSEDMPAFVARGSAADIFARAALVAGQADAAENWFTTFRAQSAGASPVLDSQLAVLAPLVSVSGISAAPAVTAEGLALWWRAMTEDTEKYRKANLLFSVLEGLSGPVPETAWQWLQDGPAMVDGKAISPVHWRAFLKAAHERNNSVALGAAFRLMQEGTAQVSMTLAGSLVGNLAAMGLEAEARRLALEILIGQGL